MRLGTLMSRAYQLVPGPLRPAFESVFLLALQGVYRGTGARCPCCERDFRAFADPPYAPWPQTCPGCGSLARHRAMWLYLSQEADVLSKPRRLLHVSPEPSISRKLRTAPGIDYVSIDLEPGKAMLRMDLGDLRFEDASFDVVICSHVLEHVTDDRKAMSELARVLKPGGWGILQVPLDLQRETTLEDPSVTDPKQRELLFGQWDHLRFYGRDYASRLAEAGLSLTMLDYVTQVGSEAAARYGLDPLDPLCIARKAG